MANGQSAVQDPRAAKAAQIQQVMGSAAPQMPLTPQLPTGSDPTLTSVLTGSTPSMPQLSTTGPVSDLDAALQRESLAQSQYGREQLAAQIARIRGLGNEQAGLRQQEADLATRLSYHPQFKPITGQGFGHDVLNFLGDLGKGALSLGASTGPGQAVQGVVYSQPRQQYANTAQRIREIQAQLEGEKEIVPSAASLAYHAPMAMAHGLRGEAETRHFSNEDALNFQKLTQHQFEFLKTLPIKVKQLEVAGKKVDAENLRTQADLQIADIMAAAKNFATQAGIDNNEMDNWVRGQIANITQETGMAKEHPYGTRLGITPTVPQVQTGSQPARKAVMPGSRPGSSNTAAPNTGSGVVDQLVKKHGGQ